MDIMTTTNIYFNYFNFLKITFIFIFLANIFRAVFKTEVAILEMFFIFSLLFLSILYIYNNKIKIDKSAVFYILIFYLLIHFFYATFIRPLELDISIFDTFFLNFLEFRLMYIGFLLPLIFIPMLENEQIDKVNAFVYKLLKFFVILYIAEQILSQIGLRVIFEYIHTSSGLYDPNIRIPQRLGIYRGLGVVGHPTWSGLISIIAFYYALEKSDKKWVVLSLFSIIFSVTYTAFAILVITLMIYFLHKKYYLLFIFLFGLLSLLFIFTYSFLLYIEDQYMYLDLTNPYYSQLQFLYAIRDYFETFTSSIQPDNTRIEGGPLTSLYNYFANNPLNILFGKGLTYAHLGKTDIPFSELMVFHTLSSDYGILTFIEQYGAIGFILLTLVFLILPLYYIRESNFLDSYILIMFYLGMMHYTPVTSKLLMMLVGFSVFRFYSTVGQNLHKNKVL